MSEMRKPFWYVWCPVGRNPQYKHDNIFSAQNEAKRLARENPGSTFVILEAKAAYQVREPIEYIEFHNDADIPF